MSKITFCQKIKGKKIIIKKLLQSENRFEYEVKKYSELILVLLSINKSATVSVYLTGRAARARIIGLVRGEGNDSITFTTLQHHKAAETVSNLLVKSVLKGKSRFDYEGSIVVDKVAQKTDAYQRNENLLLGARASAVSSPALEILANDVRCTHGAVVKTVDENELWYLASRGIDYARGRIMIADGFLKSTVNDICLTPKQYKTIFPS